MNSPPEADRVARKPLPQNGAVSVIAGVGMVDDDHGVGYCRANKHLVFTPVYFRLSDVNLYRSI